MPTSTIRYYEKEGLLPATDRSESGYRLYEQTAVSTLQFIQRAQRLGFSLGDIRLFLNRLANGQLPRAEITHTAEQRFFAIEKQLTALLVVRHELGLFLQDLHQQVTTGKEEKTAVSLFDDLIERICRDPKLSTPDTMLNWLLQTTGCHLTTVEGQALIQTFKDQHIHVWQEGDAYQILVVSHETAVAQALHALAQLEANCTVHDHTNQLPILQHNDEGYLLTCQGENAYIFARLFLSINA
jgi:DNA-binding transcriptional MerR regulator